MPSFTTAPPPSGPNNVPRDGHGRYLIPRYPLDGPMAPGADPIPGEGMAQPWTRVSTIAKVLQDNYGIGQWQLRMAVKGLGVRPDLYALAAATHVDDRRTLQEVADQAMEAARAKASANLGTALHAFTDQVDRGETPEVPQPWDRDITAYSAALVRERLELMTMPVPGQEPIRLQEMRVVLPQLADGNAAGAAGTFDRIVLWDAGDGKGPLPTVADLKTGGDPLQYGATEISVQLGRYATAWAIWDGSHFIPMPANLRMDKALVIHLRAGSGECSVYVVDLNPGHGVVQLALQVRAWRKLNKELYRLVDREVATNGHATSEPDEVPEPGGVAGVDYPDQEESASDFLAAQDQLKPLSSLTNPTPQQIEDEATLARRRQAVADKAKHVSAELDTGQPVPGPGAEIGTAAAGVDKTKRACSVCRQTGHRAGSPKCPGAPTQEITNQGPGYGTPDDMAAAEQEIKDTGGDPGQDKPCFHTSGWTKTDAGWACPDCGKVGAAPADPIPGTQPEHPVGATVTVGGVEFTKTGTSPFPDQDTQLRDQHGAADLVGKAERGEPVADPFDEPNTDLDPANKDTWAERFAAAKTRDEVREVRALAQSLDEWDQRLIKMAVDRLEEIAREVGSRP